MDNNEKLKPGINLVLAEAAKVTRGYGHDNIGLNHYLYALLMRHGPMAEALASGLNASNYRKELEQELEKGKIGETIEPQEIVSETIAYAASAGKTQASERDLAAVLLQRASWQLIVQREATVRAPSETFAKTPAPEKKSPEADSGPAQPDRGGEPGPYRPRAKHPTPFLEKVGRDLCQEAIDGNLPTVLGRRSELEATMETLCRWTKRNPLLIGPAGVGKTTIVEALAQEIVRGDVPAPLQGLRIFVLQSSILTRGAGIMGEMEKRMHALLEEASQDGIVLFIDEIHTIVGSGGARQISDIGSLLKPALAKGEIACIGATTDAEFHTFIEQDRALTRRFQPLRVQELSADASLEILRTLNKRASDKQNITFTDQSLKLIILLAQQYLRNRYFPDKAIDIFEQCLANALLNGVEKVTVSIVRNVVERMIGIPVDLGVDLSRRLTDVRKRLTSEAFCPDRAADQIVNRLEITMRGLDVSPVRPNAILLVAATVSESPELTGQVLAEALFGDRNRTIEVDMTRFSHPADVTWLTGAPPGYVGHDNVLPFHLELSHQPWSVLLFKNVDSSHYTAQETLAQAFHSGFFNNARGDRIYLSDVVVLLTVTVEGEEPRETRRLGFPALAEEEEQASEVEHDLSSFVLPELLEEVDVSWSMERPTAEHIKAWVERWTIPDISERYHRQGLRIEWDPSLLKMLVDSILENRDVQQGTRVIEDKVLPLLVPYLGEPQKVVLLCDDSGNVQVKSINGEEDGI